LGRVAVEYLSNGSGELLGTPKGSVGNVDVERQGPLEIAVVDWTKRREDTLESLNASTEVETLFATLEEGLLDLGVLSGRLFTEDVIQEVDRVDAFGGPGSLTLQEGGESAEVDLAGMTDEDGMHVLAFVAGLRLPTVLFVEIDNDASLVAIELLRRPE
jgi:hypothetical protein